MKERLHLATPGTIYFVKSKKQLQELLATGNFLWINTHYAPYKWWQIWKRHKVIGYNVMCIKDLEVPKKEEIYEIKPGDINEKEF